MRILTADCAIEPHKLFWISVVGMVDGEIVATCIIYQWRTPCPQICYLHVHPDFRRRGYGTQIIRHCVDKCIGAGKKAIGLCVNNKNADAIEFYRKRGFTENFNDDSNTRMFAPLHRREEVKS